MGEQLVLSDDEQPLNIEQQKKRAKALAKGIAAGDASALQRVLNNHPKAQDDTLASVAGRFVKLADAQLVIARELGVPNWPGLRDHIALLDRARAELDSEAPAPDGDISTAHIRCGSDIREGLNLAGFVGDFIEFADPYCQGPVVDDGEFMVRRAQFIAKQYGGDYGEIVTRLGNEYGALAAVAKRYERAVLWFEHDSYDQLVLSRVLLEFARAQPPIELALICIDGFPGITRFNGIGQLSPVALRSLWSKRKVVSDEQIRLGGEVWRALCAPTPSALFAISAVKTPLLPPLSNALHRHLQELPWTRDGLSLTERLTLEALADGPRKAGAVFRQLMLYTDPCPFLGDTMYWAVLANISRGSRALISCPYTDEKKRWGEREISLTPIGSQTLAGDFDWLKSQPSERYVGGVRIAPEQNNWRWNGERSRPQLC